ncbi:MAG: hypothetical protein ACEQSL_09745, partial [Sediminibacterium sp.]
MVFYKFYLDGNLVENPIGWDEMITVIKRDKDLRGLFVTMDATFTFTESGFTYLKSVFDTSGYCADVILKVEQSTDAGQNYLMFYDGIIKISDVVFGMRLPNLENEIIVKQYATTKVLDNSFFSKIYNNRTLKTNVCAGKTKNNLDITPVYVNYLRIFDPANGAALALDQRCALLWYDVFRYFIEFMTDAEVTFGSTLFQFGTGDFSDSILTYGLPLWNQGGGITLSQTNFIANLPKLDFITFFKEINIHSNIGLYIDNSGAKPKVVIERWNDLYKNDSSAEINNINSIITRISVDDIFSRLKLGTTETIESLGALHFPESINYLGFKEEEYIVVGKCNIDAMLDLTGEFITSSNVIEEITINNPAGSGSPNKSYNDKYFLIDCDRISAGLYEAKQSNWLDATLATRYYNERFTNSNVANQFLKGVPNDIADYLGGVLDARFKAILTANYPTRIINQGVGVSLDPIKFDNDSTPPAFDTNGVYNNITNEFQVQPLGAGIYSFYSKVNTELRFTANGAAGNHITLNTHQTLYFDRYDSLSNLIYSYQATDQFYTNNFTIPI